MEDEFLANSLLIHIEGEIAWGYSYEDIISDLPDLKKGKVDFWQALVLYVNVFWCARAMMVSADK
jgi:hypothetical protein